MTGVTNDVVIVKDRDMSFTAIQIVEGYRIWNVYCWENGKIIVHQMDDRRTDTHWFEAITRRDQRVQTDTYPAVL